MVFDPPVDDRRECPNCGGGGDYLIHKEGPVEEEATQERQRREQAEGLLREVRPMFDHIAGETGERIDKHFGEWDE